MAPYYSLYGGSSRAMLLERALDVLTSLVEEMSANPLVQFYDDDWDEERDKRDIDDVIEG